MGQFGQAEGESGSGTVILNGYYFLCGGRYRYLEVVGIGLDPNYSRPSLLPAFTLGYL